MAVTDLIGSSAKFRASLEYLEMIAPVDSAVLIEGETGTRKEVIARAIHQARPRCGNRFVALTCAAIPSALGKSELLSCEKGAYTGAVDQAIGRFQAASRGQFAKTEGQLRRAKAAPPFWKTGDFAKFTKFNRFTESAKPLVLVTAVVSISYDVVSGLLSLRLFATGTTKSLSGEGAHAMSFRIDRVSSYGLIVLLLSGKLTGEHVETLRNMLREESGALAIDLKDVSLVNRDGVQLLALAEDNGAELRNCPTYVRQWVNQERAARHGEN